MQSFLHAAVFQSSVNLVSKPSAGKSEAKVDDDDVFGTVINTDPLCKILPGSLRSAGQSMITGTMRSAET